jgi:hypothetical protein
MLNRFGIYYNNEINVSVVKKGKYILNYSFSMLFGVKTQILMEEGLCILLPKLSQSSL